MDSRQITRRELLRIVGVGTAASVLAACQPKIIEKAVVQTVVVEKEVTSVVEKEVTSVVEKEVTSVVEKEVTRIVERAPQPNVRIEYPTHQWEEPHNRPWLQKLKETVEEEYPHITLNIYQMALGVYREKMPTRMAAGNPPDILHVDAGTSRTYSDMGLLEPLDGKEGFDDITKRFYAVQSQSPFVVNGQTFSILSMIYDYALFYNKTQFADQGIEPPTTPEEFLDVCREATVAPDIFGYAFVTKPGGLYMMKFSNLWIFNMAYGGENPGRPDRVVFTDPAFIQSVELHKTVFDEKLVPQQVDPSQYRPMWWSGKVSMIPDGNWVWGMAQNGNPDYLENLWVAPMPTGDGRTLAGYSMWSTPSQAKNVEEAWKVVRTFCSPELQKYFLEVSAQVPGDKSALSEEWLSETPWFKAFAENLDNPGNQSGLADGWETHTELIRNIMVSYFDEVLFSDKDAATAMREAEEEVNLRLQEK